MELGSPINQLGSCSLLPIQAEPTKNDSLQSLRGLFSPDLWLMMQWISGASWDREILTRNMSEGPVTKK